MKNFVGGKPNWGFVYVSAKEAKRIDQIFIKAIELLVDKNKKVEPSKESIKEPKKEQKLKSDKEKEKIKSNSCC